MSYNSTLNHDVVITKLDAVVYQEYEAQPGPDALSVTDEVAYHQSSTDRAAVITDNYGGVGYFTERNEEQDLAGATPRIGNTKTSSVLNFAKQVVIPKHFFDDAQFDAIGKMMQDFGRKARVTKELKSQGLFRNAFTTQLTNDGVAFISANHTTVQGDTVSNLVTGALADATLESAIISLRTQKAQDGTVGGHEASALIVPPALNKTAFIVTEAVLRPGTANNDPNWFSAKYGIVVKVGNYMGSQIVGGSDTAWFLFSRYHNVYRWVRQELVTNLVPYQYTPNWSYIYSGEYREVYDTITYEGAVGSTGL